MLKNKRLPRLWLMRLISFISFLLLAGCGGLQVTDCISNPKANNFICYNGKNGKHLNMTPQQVDGFIFLSPADEGSMLTACQNRTTAKVNVCVFSASTLSFACFNEVSNLSGGMSFAQSENWIGVSAVDESLLLNYCFGLK